MTGCSVEELETMDSSVHLDAFMKVTVPVTQGKPGGDTECSELE